MNQKLLVPDIGDFEKVEVIEILVKVGDSIKVNDPIVTIESDKSSVEIPSNYDGKIQLQLGFSLQTSEYNTSVEVIDGLPPTNQFLRTPSNYGYSTITYTPSNTWKTTLNVVHTGSMLVPHFAGAPEQDIDELITTNNFLDLGVRNSYTLRQKSDKSLELFFGIKNILNAYQNDFDTGKNRDSNYIYGPSMPRTLFAGIRLRSI